MSVSAFTLGQRWISNTEPELGLGIVVECITRRVVINFPAAEMQRTYAEKNAPISRIEFQIGDKVRSAQGVEITIEERINQNGCWFYMGNNEEGESLVLPELELHPQITLNKPRERLLAGQIDRPSRYQLRLQTLKNRYQQQRSDSFGLAGPRIQLLSHQLYIAHEVGRRHAPRVLLADEVGLGKTIEAGLILHQQLITGRAERVLILVPDALLYQWLVEMLRRFNLSFTLLDNLRYTTMELSGQDNPFESAQRILCPYSLIGNDDERLQKAKEAGWDLLICDEAHHLGWSEEVASHLYLCVEQLANATAGLLLLTATPEQLGVEGHFARLRLLDPERFSDFEQFKQEQAGYRHISNLVDMLAEEPCDVWQKDAKTVASLEDYLGDDWFGGLASAADDTAIAEQIQLGIDQLLDQQGTGRVLFRNTRESIGGFPGRKLYSYPLSWSSEALNLYQDDLQELSLSQQLHPETQLGEDWLQLDSRVEWLKSWLLAHRYEKVLLICHRKETAAQLEEYFRLRVGLRTAAFHEGLSLLHRDRAAAYFADKEEGAQVLFCSEIGSEGRNFQFASHLVMFDLPLNPDLLEQRIGRLDRIGQAGEIQIHLPYYENGPSEVLMRWYHQGLNAFERAFPAGQVVYQAFATELHELLEEPEADPQRLAELLEKTALYTDELLMQLQQGRDRLVERNSCHPVKAAELVEQLGSEDRLALTRYMELVFDQFGVEQIEHGPSSFVLHPSDQMLFEHFPGLPDEGVTATFSRYEALSREDMQFLSWEHPMVTGSMDLIVNTEFGNSCVCTLKLPPLKQGTLLIEGVFVMHCAAPAYLQVARYLDQSMVRKVVDNLGNDLSAVLQVNHLNSLSERVSRSVGQNLIRHFREPIVAMTEQLEGMVSGMQQQLIEDALKQVEKMMGGELSRLRSLAKRNPNVRQIEIEAMEAQKAQLIEAISSATLQLDAVRLVVVSE